MAEVNMFAVKGCPYCDYIEQMLVEEGAKKVTRSEVEVLIHERNDLYLLTQSRQVPQVFINGTHVGDFDDVASLKHSGKLKELLAA